MTLYTTTIPKDQLVTWEEITQKPKLALALATPVGYIVNWTASSLFEASDLWWDKGSGYRIAASIANLAARSLYALDWLVAAPCDLLFAGVALPSILALSVAQELRQLQQCEGWSELPAQLLQSLRRVGRTTFELCLYLMIKTYLVASSLSAVFLMAELAPAATLSMVVCFIASMAALVRGPNLFFSGRAHIRNACQLNEDLRFHVAFYGLFSFLPLIPTDPDYSLRVSELNVRTLENELLQDHQMDVNERITETNESIAITLEQQVRQLREEMRVLDKLFDDYRKKLDKKRRKFVHKREEGLNELDALRRKLPRHGSQRAISRDS